MSHPSQFSYVNACANLLSKALPAPNIIEIGSYDVNGSIRSCFPMAKSYIGLDLISGPGVDVIGSGHEYGVSNTFDIAISCECFEHNPYWLETFLNMVRITKPGGLIIFTCATKGRAEHGTARAHEWSNPGGVHQGWEYYKNLTRSDFERKIDFSRHFDVFEFFVGRHSKDLMFYGVKSGWQKSGVESAGLTNISMETIRHLRGEVNKINQINPKIKRDYPVLGRIHSFVLIIASQVLGDKGYQDFRFFLIRLSKHLTRRFRGDNEP